MNVSNLRALCNFFWTVLICVVVGITAATTCSIISAVAATSAAIADIAVAGITAVGCTTAAATATMSSTIEHAISCYSVHLIYPSAGSKPGAVPKSSYASPFSSCEYQNTVCFGTP